jgi:antitoxin component YwqK of YwqJK toxin-antitoxin module
MEKYEIENNKIIILDEELKIDIRADFFLEKLPLKFHEKNFKLEENDLKSILGCEIVLEKEKSGEIKKTYLKKNNKMHGECILYENKKVLSSSFYFENKLHGPSIFYNEKGGILSMSFFYFGRREGKVKRYYLSGEKYCIERYVKNLKNGRQEYFYERGNLKSDLFYENDCLKRAFLYFENGKIKREIVLDENIDNIYDENGDIL